MNITKVIHLLIYCCCTNRKLHIAVFGILVLNHLKHSGLMDNFVE